MSGALNELRDALEQAGCVPARAGRELRAKCPACGAGPDAFVARVDDRGAVVCECEAAQCAEGDILRALGLVSDDAREPFPIDELPTTMRELVREVAESVDVDPAMVAPHCLAVAAAAIGDSRCVRVKRDYIAPPVLWVAVVARSGAGKSPAMNPAIRPLDDLQREAYEQHRAEASERRSDDDPASPMEQTTIRHVTLASLRDVLTHNPRGVLGRPPELGEWLRSHGQFDRARGPDTEAWLALHDGSPVQINRKTDGATYIPNPRVSLCSTIQPSEAYELFSGRLMGNGLVQRLLLCEPPHRQRRWSERELSASTAEAWASTVRTLRMLEPTTDEREHRRAIEIGMDHEAKRRYVALFDDMNERAEGASEALASALSKLPDACARIALVLHLADEAARRLALETPTAITGESMRRAVAVTRWYADETARLYTGTLAGDPRSDRLSRELSELLLYIRDQGGRVTPRELARNKSRYKGTGGANRARADLEALASAGLGELAWESAGKGRGGDVFTLATPTE